MVPPGRARGALEGLEGSLERLLKPLLALGAVSFGIRGPLVTPYPYRHWRLQALKLEPMEKSTQPDRGSAPQKNFFIIPRNVTPTDKQE